jgi:hypothetical protein
MSAFRAVADTAGNSCPVFSVQISLERAAQKREEWSLAHTNRCIAHTQHNMAEEKLVIAYWDIRGLAQPLRYVVC